jgi:hypothetical protein
VKNAETPIFYVGLLLFAAFLYAVSVTTVGANSRIFQQK